MNTKLFRKVSLSRLESPDQLDQILKVTDSKSWIGLIGLLLLLVAAVFWGFEGSIVTTAKGQGVLVRRGGVLNVVTNEAGLVNTLTVKVGDRIEAHQVIATVAQPALLEKIRTLQQSIAETNQEQGQLLENGAQSVKLQVSALARQKENAQRQISELVNQEKLASDQIAVQDQLYAKGLVTRQAGLQARQRLEEIKDQEASLKATLLQLDAQRFGLESQPGRDSSQSRERVQAMQKTLGGLQQELGMAQNVTSPYGGEILEVGVFPGNAVAAGQAIISIQPNSQDIELLAYVPSLEAKNIKGDMEVQISPSTFKREEYGFLRGKVVHAADFPATPAAMMRNFENGLLVDSLTASGPVNELEVTLQPNSGTPSGFAWSTSRSPAVRLTSGTLCSVQVVTRRQRPINWVFPYIKGQLGLS